MSTVNSSGFKYRMSSLGIDSSCLLAGYDFISGSDFSNRYLDSPGWLSGSGFSGKINGPAVNFYKYSGSGFLDGSTSISVLGKIPDDDFLFLFCYEKMRSGNEILLSSSYGSTFASSSGLTIGVNDSNKLYLEYWNPVYGVSSLDYEENIASKNLVYFRKSFGEFQLGIFDPIESSLDYSVKSFDSSSYLHSDKFTIGQSNSSWSTGRMFSGCLDDFYCMSGKIPQSHACELFSGFYSIPSSGLFSGTGSGCTTVSTLSGSGVILGTGITGYETVVTYSTSYVPTGYIQSGYSYFVGFGVTGYETTYLGLTQDACGTFNPTYAKTPLNGNIYATGTTGVYTGVVAVITPTYTNKSLTGLLTGQVFVPVSTNVCSGFDVYYPKSLFIDSGFIGSLGFNGIYSYYQCGTIFSNECYFYTGDFYQNINLAPQFDSNIPDWKIDSSHSGSGKNLIFNNGQLLLESGWSSYSSGFSTLYNITGNIFLDGNVIRSNGYNDSYDNLIYDNSNIIYLKTGANAGLSISSAFSSAYSDYSIFLNGVKMLSGLDYSSSQFLFSIPESSVLIKINNNYISNKKQYITGLSNTLSLNGNQAFCNNSSQVYVNGLRQLIDYDYSEISRFSILTGCPVSSSSNNQFAYSYSSDFWNI